MNIRDIPLYRQAVARAAGNLAGRSGRVLVTGASGMIGSCLTDTLVRANRDFGASFDIFVLSRSREKLEARFEGDGVTALFQDIAAPLPDIGFDYILHAASAADPRSYARYPVETIWTNAAGARSVLEACRGRKTRALLCSTFEVYGKLDRDEYREEDFGLLDENQLRSAYPESKRVAELLFRAYRDEYGTDTLIARLPSVYGPTMSAQDNKAHAEFLWHAARGEDIVLKSEGLPVRTYCCLMDVVSALFFLLFHGESGEAYNVSNAQAVISIADLARKIAALAGTQVVFRLPTREEQKGYSRPQNILLNPEKINRLGWRAQYGLDEGLRLTLEILRQAQG